MEDNYKKAENFLKQGRQVLFSGTPCQIAGLKLFLRKEYENLLAVDFICHGVPSPKVWRMYLDETWKKMIEQGGKNTISSVLSNEGRKSCIEAISFRNKISGWKKYSFFLKLNSNYIRDGKNTVELCEPVTENIFMKGFLADLYLRPSCYQCAAKYGKSGSDITIADFWGIQNVVPEMDDDKGTSLVFVNASPLKKFFFEETFKGKIVQYKKAIKYNKGVNENIVKPHHRTFFFSQLPPHESIENLIKRSVQPSIIKRLKKTIRKFLKK